MKFITTFLITAFFSAAAAATGPLKVFILAGQSNMEGHAAISTFDYIGQDPLTAPILKDIQTLSHTRGVPSGLRMSLRMGAVSGS